MFANPSWYKMVSPTEMQQNVFPCRATLDYSNMEYAVNNTRCVHECLGSNLPMAFSALFLFQI